MRIIQLFHQNKLSYNLFKCEHIFDGSNKNLDILFENVYDYCSASRLLEKEGYVLYMPESIERYKRMYTLFRDGVVTHIHLHREVAWHGLRVFNKKNIFSHAKMQAPSIFVPSAEDQLLIHVAHIVFENMVISNHARHLISTLLSDQINWNHVQSILKKERWGAAFDHVVFSVKNKQQPRMGILVTSFVKKVIVTPSSWFPLSCKFISIVLRTLSFRRNGCLIAFVGVNGSGKTTLTKNVLTAYFPLSRTVNGQVGYYFGWMPFSPLSKMVSNRLTKKNKHLFKEMSEKKKGFFVRETFFFFNYLEYLSRYLIVVRPQLVRNKLVVTDRYFYDLYGQYHSAAESWILPLLLRLYPQPDYLFVLDADIPSLRRRGKFGGQRTVKDTADLEGQRKRYSLIGKKFHGIVLDTARPMEKNIDDVICRSWASLVR